MHQEINPLRTVLVGHVDHGKSTLVGRLLYETGSLEDGKYEAVQRSCERRGVPFEWAFLTDALQAERNQNVTIDAAQIWFESGDRTHNVIDAPGHKEFLKNMVTGASAADAALLLIAADEGVEEQSRRHGHLLSMLGIDQVAVVINKMDLVDYNQDRFQAIVDEYSSFLSKIDVSPTAFLPVSARDGVNLASEASEHMPWYKGSHVLAALDAFDHPALKSGERLRFPVQAVYRFDERRILAGRVESGQIRVGDDLVFTPHGKSATVATIERWNAPASDKATAGESIGITLTEQLFVERGQVAAKVLEAPQEATTFRANLFWMGRDRLVVDQRYKLKLATQEVPCTVRQIDRIIDGSSLDPIDEERAHIECYEVAEVEIETKRPVAIENHDLTPALGRFVLVDGYDVAGGGIVLEADQHQANLHWHESNVGRRDRERLHGHRGVCVWLTGLSGSGKSSIAVELESQLHHRGVSTYILDGDNIRHGLSANLGFSAADRDEHIRRVGEVSRLFVDAGVIVISAFISPYQRLRDRVRESLEPGQFIEIFVDASLEACERRDPKGLYEKARAGEIQDFTGISAPYEPPPKPELVIDTVADANARASAERIVQYLIARRFLQTPREGALQTVT